MIKWNKQVLHSIKNFKFINLNIFSNTCKNIIYTNYIKKFSVLEATFIQSIKEQNLNEFPKYDIMESSQNEEFKILLIDDPENFFLTLKEALRKVMNGQGSDKRNTSQIKIEFEKILSYVEIIFQNVLLYESSLEVYEPYKQFINYMIQEIFKSDDKNLYKNLIEDFITTKIMKLEYNSNIYVLFFIYSLLMNKSEISENYCLYNDYNPEKYITNTSIEKNLAYLFRNNIEIKIDKFLKLIFFSISTIFKDLVTLTKKRNYSTFIVNNNIKEKQGSSTTPELIIMICDILTVLNCFIMLEIKAKSKFSDFTNVYTSIDEILAEYILSHNASYKLIYYVMHTLLSTKNKFKSNNIVLPYTYSNLCRIFIFNKGVENNTFRSLLIYWMRDHFKESYTVSSVNLNFKAVMFYIHNHITKPDVMRQISTIDLVEYLYFFTYIKFDINKEFVDIVYTKVDEFLENNFDDCNLLVTAFSSVDRPYPEVYRKVLTDPRINLFTIKKYINIGFYAALAKFDDEKIWKNWLDNLQNRNKFNFNFLDIKMLKDIKFFFRLIGPQYKFYEQFSDKLELGTHNIRDGFVRWFHSNNINKESLLELPFSKYLEDRSIKFTSQFLIKENQMDADFLLGEKIILEICGPSHYLIANTIQMDKKTKLKKEIFESMGYFCVFINYLFIPSENEKAGYYILDTIKNSVPEKEYLKIFK